MAPTIRFQVKNELLLLSGADIPFVEGTVTIHQPTLYEISLIGEEALFEGCELLRFTKDILTSEDKNKLFNYSDFNILMSIMNDKSGSMIHQVSCANQVLELLFPLYDISFSDRAIIFIDRNDKFTQCGEINDTNFLAFKEVITNIFCLKQASTTQDYNVQGELAKKIAEKFRRRQQQLAELSTKPKKVAIFSRYISILTVGEHKDMNSFMKYTVYQLFDEFQRYQLKVSYDVYFKARMAGAKDMKEPEDWMKDIHE